MGTRLCQVIAISKGAKGRAESTLKLLNRASQNPDIFNGFSKTYLRKDEEGGDTYPDENKQAQITCSEILNETRISLTELWDIVASVDYGNAAASANVTIDGNVIIENAPPTLLLFLEKQLENVRTIVNNLPELDDAVSWVKDNNNQDQFRTPNVIITERNKKMHEVLSLAKATAQHPEQVQVIQVDRVVGHWHTIKFSGAMSKDNKRTLLIRILKMQKAVKFAREEANTAEISRANIAKGVFNYLFETEAD